MSEWKEQKDAFLRLAIDTGMGSLGEIRANLPLGSSVSPERLEKWLNGMLRIPKNFAPQRRYVNRFKLGADPEFVFGRMNSDHGCVMRVNASNLGLSQGPAFGADNNGRLAEIRPFPSRSAVEVVASLLTTLRWMVAIHPDLVGYEWRAGAYQWDDGLGGHVHFGRKRPFREREIKALDAIEEGLLGLGVFPGGEVKQRRAGDSHRQLYGLPGDFRLQAHGYEYRTYPSWLDSPDLAFLTVVLSKLAVQCPGLYASRKQSVLAPFADLQRIKNFLAYFKHVDDDARLALILLGRGIPRHLGGDFKGRWGIGQGGDIKAQKVGVIPLSIRPDKESVEEVFRFLLNGSPLKFRVPEFTWGPVNPPEGMKMCIQASQTILAKGLGEMIWDLCSPYAIPFTTSSRGARGLNVGDTLEKKLPRNWRSKFRGITVGVQRGIGCGLIIAPEWREGGKLKILRAALLSGAFPIWKVGDVRENSLENWEKSLEARKSKRFNGNVLYETKSWRIGPLA